MEAVITQNFLNIMNSYMTKKYRSEFEGDLPSQFTNNPNVDDGRNVITMSTGTYTNNVYERTPSVENQKLLRVCRDCVFSASSNYVKVYDNNLSVSDVSVYNTNYPIITPPSFPITSMTTVSTELFNSTNGLIPMLFDDDTPITLQTTDHPGRIVSYNNRVVNTEYNDDGSLTVTYNSTIPSTVSNFTLKSVLFSCGSNSSYARDFWHANNLPPVILFGCVLDVPIELYANDSIKLVITFKPQFMS